MHAYHNNPSIKSAILEQLEAHRAAGELVHGVWWQNGKGSAVGCAVHSSDHEEYERRFGIPQMLARLEDAIFEELFNADAQAWPERFMGSIEPGMDLSRVGWEFLYWLLTDKEINPGIAHPHLRDAVEQCVDVVAPLMRGAPAYTAQSAAAESAGNAAWSARSAAWSARCAAWSARCAADAVEMRGAAASAQSAAYAAQSAADSAGNPAWSALSAGESVTCVANAAWNSAYAAQGAGESATCAAEPEGKPSQSSGPWSKPLLIPRRNPHVTCAAGKLMASKLIDLIRETPRASCAAACEASPAS
jgi:hypothetical protein